MQKTDAFIYIFTSLVIGLASIFSLVTSMPPPVAENISPNEFSAIRAMDHIAIIAESPHPAGSARQVEVGQYLLDVLNDLGLSPEVQAQAKFKNIAERYREPVRVGLSFLWRTMIQLKIVQEQPITPLALLLF